MYKRRLVKEDSERVGARAPRVFSVAAPNFRHHTQAQIVSSRWLCPYITRWCCLYRFALRAITSRCCIPFNWSVLVSSVRISLFRFERSARIMYTHRCNDDVWWAVPPFRLAHTLFRLAHSLYLRFIWFPSSFLSLSCVCVWTWSFGLVVSFSHPLFFFLQGGGGTQ